MKGWVEDEGIGGGWRDEWRVEVWMEDGGWRSGWRMEGGVRVGVRWRRWREDRRRNPEIGGVC